MPDRKHFGTKLGNVGKCMYIFLILFFLLLILGQVLLPPDSLAGNTNVELFPGEWRWVESGKLIIPGESYANGNGEHMTITSMIPKDFPAGSCICLRASQQNVEIRISGLKRAEHISKIPYLGRNSFSGYLLCELNEEDAGRIISVEYSTYSMFSGVINEIYMCSRYDFWSMVFKNSIYEFLGTIVFFTLGAISMIIGIILRIRFEKKQLLEYLGAIMLFTSMYVASDMDIRQLLFPNSAVIGASSYIVAVFLLVAIQLYADTMQERRYHKFYAILQITTYTIIPVSFLLVFLGVMEFVETSYITFVFIGITVILILVTSIIDAVQKRDDEYRSLVYSIFILISLCIVGYLLNIRGKSRLFFMGLYPMFGLLFVLFTTSRKTVNDLEKITLAQQRMLYEKEAKDLFFATISHEIRTPINSVLGMNEMILRENESETIQEYALNIENSGRMLLSLVNDFLDFSKIQSGGLTLNDVRYSTVDLLRDTVNIIKERVDSKIKFITDFSPELPGELIGDDVRIKQVIINLLTNACKYTEKGCIIYTVAPANEGSLGFALKISVKDTGKGIKKENIDKLYDAYMRVEDSDNRTIEGTGLGLAITKNLLNLMNGTIDVESEVGRGTLFTVIIPQRVLDSTPIGDNLDKKTSSASTRTIVKVPGRKLLIVDDNLVNLKVISGLLKKSEMDIETATGGAEAVKKCQDKMYDLIFMDHMMPDMDGFMTKDAIKADENGRNNKTPIIALTANVPADAGEIYIKNGFSAYLSKPIDTTKLNLMIKDFFHEAQFVEIETAHKSRN